MVAGAQSTAADGVLLVHHDFAPGPGIPLTPTLTIGRLLGSGMQVCPCSISLHALSHPLPRKLCAFGAWY